MSELFSPTLITVIVSVFLFLFLATLVLVAYSRLYKRAEADEALVRTGKGGTRAVAGGGMFVIPIFHTFRRIPLNQVMISITRTGKDALITTDKIRADVEGTMYVRVGDTDQDIIQAAKTFSSLSTADIERLIQDKVTDAMRAEAMKVSFLELNVNKREFGEAIAAAVQQDLKKTGLVLDSVAVTSIRQVPVNPEAIPMDVFEAEGVRNIVAVVEKNREETNRIRREKEVLIQQVDVEARTRSLLLEEQQRQAEADQEQRISEYEATKDAESRLAVLEQQRRAEEAAIAKEEEVAKRGILRDKAIAVEAAAKEETETVARIRAAQASEEADIEKKKAVEAAMIEKEQAIEAAAIVKAQTIETAEVEKEKAVAQAKTDEARARAAMAVAEAEEEEAQQSIQTVRERAEADRKREVVIIKSKEEAQRHQILADRDAYVQTRTAEAERDARKAMAEAEAFEAEERARARREEAQGRADAQRIDADGHAYDVMTRAKADAEASELQARAKIELAAAMLEQGKADAEAERLRVAARNEIAPHVLLGDVAIAAIQHAPAMIDAFMKPAAAVGEVKVLQLHGLNGHSDGNAADQLGGSLPGIVANTLAQSAGLAPIIKTMLDFAQRTGMDDQAKGAVGQLATVVRAAVHDALNGDCGERRGEIGRGDA